MKINLDEYVLDDRIFNVKFSCDVMKCKGACCTLEGTFGAPISKSEIDEIREVLPKAKKYLSERNLEVIEREGFYIKHEGEYSLNNVDDNDCVFSFYDENKIAKCSFQQAYINREIDFVKPVSCHLFPIRISGKKKNVLRYEKMYECNTALDKGKEENITILEFAKTAVIREYGEDFYNQLEKKFIKK